MSSFEAAPKPWTLKPQVCGEMWDGDAREEEVMQLLLSLPPRGGPVQDPVLADVLPDQRELCSRLSLLFKLRP